ncbi:MAG: hypothetical protein QOD08_2370 [Gaiellaceae bacterium]|nr:hypothetical protein [Gaiellaceae bacterium]
MLVARRQELALVGRSIRTRRPIVVLGEAGVGKSALLHAAGDCSGYAVFAGGGLQTLSSAEFLPLVRALREPLPAGDRRFLAGFVADRVGDGLLILDDLQWADRATRSLLPLLVGHVRLVGAIRNGDRDTRIALRAVERAGFEVLDLQPLREKAALELARSVRPWLGNGDLRAIVASARGNAFLIEHLGAESDVSTTLALSLKARFDRCSPTARRALAALALLGRPAEQRVVPGAATELVEAGLVTREGKLLELRHAALAEIAAAALSAEERRTVHSGLARALGDPAEAARHHAAAGEHEAALAKALASADAADSIGDRARHLALAASVAPGGAERDGLLVRASGALHEAGDFPEAERLAGLVRTDEGILAAEGAFQRACALWSLGRADEAVAVAREALELVDGKAGQLELRLRLELIGWDLHRGGARRTVEDARFALALAQAVQSEEARAHLLLARSLTWTGSLDEGRVHFEAALERAEGTGDLGFEFEAIVGLSMNACLARRFPSARRVLARAARRARLAGLRSWELEFRWRWAHVTLYSRGRYSATVPKLRACLEASAFGRIDPEQIHADLALALADTGRLAEARELLQDHRARLQTTWGRATNTLVRAEVEWLARDPARALKAIVERLSIDESEDLAQVLAMRDWACADLGVPSGDPGFTATSGVSGSPWFALFGKESEALRLLATPGREGDAEGLFLELVDAWEGNGFRYALRCLLGAARAAAQVGAVDRARQHLFEAERRAEAEGMSPWLARVRGSLRVLGVRRPLPGKRTDGLLSTREREILELVGGGLTTREIAGRLAIASSTVETLVRSSMAKLGAHTRKQAAATASGRDE